MNTLELQSRLLQLFPALLQLPAPRWTKSCAAPRQAPAGTSLFEAASPCTAFPVLLAGGLRAMVSRLLSNFRDRGWFELGREQLRITDAAALRRLEQL